MPCRSGCKTQDHPSWGACARAADLQIDRFALQHSRNAEKDKDRRLDSYADLRKSGVQPKSTQWHDVRAAQENGGTRPTEVNSGGENGTPSNRGDDRSPAVVGA